MIVANVFDELKWRGLVYDCTEGLPDLLAGSSVTVYNGFDPTADSLHVGHFVPMMGLARLQRFGHTPIAVAGGGTGLIGDPSGKSDERNLLTREQIENNLTAVERQLAGILDFETRRNPARIVNNADWLCEINMMEFLRDVGKHFSVNYMMAKDSVRSRLDRDGVGISYTEFSYMLLQSYDFLVLHDRFGCRLQAGGSDQWGNITAGVELIRRMRGQSAHGLVYPLITKADGTKFGKTETGTVWLDPGRTSPYRFYQFWLNTDDANVVAYLKYFTWLTHREILELELALLKRPEEREAQRRLAEEVTRMVHGETALARAQQASEVLFGGEIAGLDAADIADIFADVPSSELPRTEMDGDGKPLIDLLVHTGLAGSRSDAKRAIMGGGIYLNNVRVADLGYVVDLADAIDGQFVILRKGRKKYHLIRALG